MAIRTKPLTGKPRARERRFAGNHFAQQLTTIPAPPQLCPQFCRASPVQGTARAFSSRYSSIARLRSLTVEQRTAQINQIRGLLLEYGIEIPAGRSNLLKRLPEILEDAENSLTDLFRTRSEGSI